MDTKHNKPLLVRIPEAAEMLGLGRSTVYELIAAGEIRPVRVGRAVRVSTAALEEWVKRQEGRVDDAV